MVGKRATYKVCAQNDGRFGFSNPPSMPPFAHAHRRGGEAVEDGHAFFAEPAEGEDAGGALLNAGGAADALGVFHG